MERERRPSNSLDLWRSRIRQECLIFIFDPGNHSWKINQFYMSYFFCDDKDERLRTAYAILVNLLTQLLEQVPDVIRHFLAEPEYTTNKEKTVWNYGMLWRVFERIMSDTHCGKVYILIDALDECEEESCTKLLKQLQRLLCDATTATRPIKIVITSRPHIAVTSHLTEVIKIPLAAETLKSDISAFVEAEVYKQPQFTGSLREEVQKALIDGANGMFLWVSLILDGLKNSADTRPLLSGRHSRNYRPAFLVCI
ncbi:hypothetical protein BDD12DRAFT_236511 [Trichophaea hybrida]|nr:hypothetical protein BDD12DRAFT_236511 [Trichophaea hybrida]